MQRFDLKRFRLDRKLTQKELAEILMCKQNYISNIENGIKPISKEKLDILQSKFGDISKYYSDISPKQNTIPMSKALVETVKRATDGEFPTDSINSKLEQIKAMFENKGINPYDTLAWEISHRYRAKNSYGGYAITNCTYHFNKDISDIISVETK